MPNSAQDYLDSCLFFTVKKLNRALDRLTENAFQKVGLNPSYTSILLILSHENGKIQKDLAKMLCIDLSKNLSTKDLLKSFVKDVPNVSTSQIKERQ